MILEIVIIWFLILVTFFVGYFTGQGKMTVEQVQKLKKDIERKLDPQVGVVRRPSAQEIYNRTHPDKKAADDAMVDSLKNIPELNP